MSKKNTFEYIRTFFLTLLFILAITLFLAIMAKENATEAPSVNDFQKYKYEQLSLLIEQYKYDEKKYPQNYIINLELGLLYENTAKLKDAEEEYLKAIKKSPYGVFNPKFALADLYLKEKRFIEAISLIQDIEEYPDKNLITAKAIFYEKAAKGLYAEHEYGSAVRAYTSTCYYRSKIKSRLNNIDNDIANAFIAFANEHKDNNDYAVEIIEDGLHLLNDSPKLLYKMALLKMNTDPQKSLEILSNIQITNPSLINYDTYFNFLDKLKIQAQEDGDDIQSMIYEEKTNKLQKFVDYNIIYPGDFSIKILKCKYHKSKISFENSIELEFKIQNNTYKEIPKLFTQIDIYNNNKLSNRFEDRIIKKDAPLKPGRSTDKISTTIKFSNKNDFIQTKDVSVLIYLTKNKKVKNTLMIELSVPKK